MVRGDGQRGRRLVVRMVFKGDQAEGFSLPGVDLRQGDSQLFGQFAGLGEIDRIDRAGVWLIGWQFTGSRSLTIAFAKPIECPGGGDAFQCRRPMPDRFVPFEFDGGEEGLLETVRRVGLPTKQPVRRPPDERPMIPQ